MLTNFFKAVSEKSDSFFIYDLFIKEKFIVVFFKQMYLINFSFVSILYRYIMFGRGIYEKYQSRDEKFPEPNSEGNLVSRLVFFANTPPKHDISV